MRRVTKVLAFSGACSAALVLTISRGGDGIRVGADNQLRAATRPVAGKYDLAQLPVITKTLFYVSENYFDKSRFDHKRMLVGALDFLQRDVPEILDRSLPRARSQAGEGAGGRPGARPSTSSGSTRPGPCAPCCRTSSGSCSRTCSRSPRKDEARRLLEIEIAATNGMLYTLDPHSVLLDVESFKDMRTQTQGKFGGLGIVIEMDRKGRIVVSEPMPETPAIRAGIKAKDHIVRINNESTVNMTLNEAVERLRGDVGRAGRRLHRARRRRGPRSSPSCATSSARRRSIRRPRVLTAPASAGQPAAKIGYFRIVSFSANTESDLIEALAIFEREKVKGIIMDLREQPRRPLRPGPEGGRRLHRLGRAGVDGRRRRLAAQGRARQPQRRAQGAAGGAGQPALGQRLGDRRRRGQEPGPRRGHRRDHLRQGLGADAVRHPLAGVVRRQVRGRQAGPQADHRPVPDPGRSLDPGRGRHARRRAGPPARRRSDADEAIIQPAEVGPPPAGVGLRVAPRPPERAQGGASRSETMSYLFVPPPGREAARRRRRGRAERGSARRRTRKRTAEENRIDFPIEFARDLLAQSQVGRRRRHHPGPRPTSTRSAPTRTRSSSQALEKLGVDWTAGPAEARRRGPGAGVAVDGGRRQQGRRRDSR